LVESSYAFGRNALQGIAAYATAHGPWIFHQGERTFDDSMPRGLKAWRADGIIARISSPQLARQLRALHVPVVDLYEQGLLKRSSRVMVNHRAVMQLAVDHLRACGFQHFGYVGLPHTVCSQERSRWFANHVATWGCEPHGFDVPLGDKLCGLAAIEAAIGRYGEPLARWLRALPKPAGIVACNDVLAQQILAICNERGIDVPDLLGVIGVDNDEVHCTLSNPSLSSVDPNAYRVGYEAAALLHRMIQGRHCASQEIIVDPTGVVARRSTDVWAFADPEIAETVCFIRDHACEGIKLSAVLRHAKVSRATLDRQFLKHLGHTAKAEITRVQVQHARELLAMTDLPLKQVARRVGFQHVETMYRLLRKATNQTPAEYRRVTCRSNSWPRHSV
jgi:LacI family transcriptional regulator